MTFDYITEILSFEDLQKVLQNCGLKPNFILKFLPNFSERKRTMRVGLYAILSLFEKSFYQGFIFKSIGQYNFWTLAQKHFATVRDHLPTIHGAIEFVFRSVEPKMSLPNLSALSENVRISRIMLVFLWIFFESKVTIFQNDDLVLLIIHPFTWVSFMWRVSLDHEISNGVTIATL